jgi:type I restriction enzyme S subunit
MKPKTKNAPPLRFPEFSDALRPTNLEELSKDGFSNGVFNEPEKVGRGYRLINVKDMYVGSSIDVEALSLVDIDKKLFDRNQVKFGDVFFTRSSLVKEGIAYSNVNLNRAQDITFDGHLIKMSPNLDLVSPEFLALALRTSTTRRQLIAGGKTTTMTTIGQEDIAGVKVFLPSFVEQGKIAAFFSAVDKKIGHLARKSELLLAYKKGVVQQVFDQKIRFKDDNGDDFPDWKEERLGELGNFFSGGTPNTTKPEYFDGEIPFIRSAEINSSLTEQFISQKGFNNSSAKLVKTGDLLYALYGANSGDAGIAKIDGAINQAILCIRTSLDNRYLLNYLSLKKGRIVKTYLQGGQGNLSAELVKSFKIPVPTRTEQEKIAAFTSALDDRINLTAQQLDRLKVFKKGLLQQMFV